MDGNALYDHSMRPAILPPETRKSQLYKSPAIFEQIDKRAIEVMVILILLSLLVLSVCF